MISAAISLALLADGADALAYVHRTVVSCERSAMTCGLCTSWMTAALRAAHMNTMELVHFVSTGERPRERSPRTSTPPFYSELIRPARHAIMRARQHLLSEQRSDGSWSGPQNTD